jgi:AraC-like DNA-binding protein
VIPYGSKPVGIDRAAEMLGKSPGTLRNTRIWEKVRTLNRPGARVTHIFDEADVAAYRDGTPPPPRPAPHPRDLLDIEEARLAIPEERRPTEKTWRTYVYATDKDGIGPPADERVEGVSHWYRETIAAWASRPDGRHRTKGSRNKAPIVREGAVRNAARVAELLEADPSVTPAQVAADLGLSERQAERYLAAAGRTTVRDGAARRRKELADYLARNPDATRQQMAEAMDLPIARIDKYLAVLRG